MLKIDPAFLFELGPAMRKVREITGNTPMSYAYFTLDHGAGQIRQALEQSIYSHLFRLPTRAAANTLLAHIAEMVKKAESQDQINGKFYDAYDTFALEQYYTKLETLLLADLQAASLYLVAPKGAYDTATIIEHGEAVFATQLQAKVPAAIPDIVQATRCIAFELPTAAGFHLHRAHESVLRTYWDCVTGGAKRPRENNMGVYLRRLDELKRGKQETRSHLRSIKDFHRNPLMHPEQSLESTDEALDLLSAIRCSIGYMLREIPGADVPLLDHAAE